MSTYNADGKPRMEEIMRPATDHTIREQYPVDFNVHLVQSGI